MQFVKRIEKLIDEYMVNRIDGILISSPENKFYLGGLYSSSGYTLITKLNKYIIVDYRYFEEVKGREDLFQIKLLSEKTTLIDILNSIIRTENLSCLGFEGKEISYDFYKCLKENLNCALTSVDLSDIRAIKDGDEIKNIKIACNIADKAFYHITKFIKLGMKEKDIENELVRFIKEEGGQKESFDIIVASGIRGALPHGKASNKRINKGEFITLDFGVRYKNYCSDITRTLALGQCSSELLKIYEVVKIAGEEAIKLAKPNVRLGELDDIARKVIKDSGYGDYFRHNLGHGLGILVHEYPSVAPGANEKLKEGMVITIEPGIYISKLGGVRIEEDILITDHGCKKLTKSTRDLIII